MNFSFTRLTQWAVVLVLGTAPAAMAQVVVAPFTNDFKVSATTFAPTISHTGTDAMELPGNVPNGGRILQVSTWEENGSVYMSWGLDNNDDDDKILVSPKGSDPDVVIAERNGRVFANVVYIEKHGTLNHPQTHYVGYEWTGVFSPSPDFQHWLGDNRVERHLVPNIDANAQGLVGIVWQQRLETLTTVTVSSVAFPTYSFTQLVTFDRSYIAGSTIDGHLSKCYRYDGGGLQPDEHPPGGGVPGTHVPYFYWGRPIIDPPTGLFEQTLHPDVAISEGNEDEAILSSTFIRHYVDGLGLFSIVNNLDVKQTYYRCQGKNDIIDVADGYKEWPLFTSGSLGFPRIAATQYKDPQIIENVEVTIGMSNAECAADSLGNNAYYEIRNYGKFGTWRPDYTIVSLPRVNSQFNKQPASEPVITYYGGQTESELEYVISFTGLDYGNSNVDALDVLAISLSNGNPIYSTGIPLDYSRVNQNSKLDQHTPSIAGRHLPTEYSLAHLFVDDEAKQLSRKISRNDRAGQTGSGQGHLRPSPGSAIAPGDQPMAEAYPNPFDSSVSLQLNLRDGEQVRQLTVLDQLGRKVDQLALPTEGTQPKLTWKPARQLPSGSYTLKVVTSQRTKSLRLNRK